MKKIKLDAKISPEIAHMQRGLVLRANSILITIYGDAIAARHQSVWLGSLISLAEMFGLSPRLVRTSTFRLTADNWLTATRKGRRSFYGLSDIGQQRVQHADRRIYEFDLPPWDGCWTLAMLVPAIRASTRQHLRRELLWEGFGQISPYLFAHPQADHQSLAEILKAEKAENLVSVMQASQIAAYSQKPLQTIVHDTFKLTEVELAWKQFIARFSPFVHELHRFTHAEAFYVRTLLIHEYRRVLLRDPNLPAILLPIDWPGLQARQLCRTLYHGLLTNSEQFLLSNIETFDGRFSNTPSTIIKRMTQN